MPHPNDVAQPLQSDTGAIVGRPAGAVPCRAGTQPEIVRIGCAGWSIRKESASEFGTEGTQLERYATRFNAVEINSSFYRSHRPSTYARWAASTPERFAFAVKVPKAITHERGLVSAGDLLRQFLDEVSALGPKCGPLLVQLPPRLRFDNSIVQRFLTELRREHAGLVAFEPRHRSWFEPAADHAFRSHHVARVAADPALVPAAAEPGGWGGLRYYRLHGSPKMYYSAYSREFLARLAETIEAAPRGDAVWCIFDNTALGAANEDALQLQRWLLESAARHRGENGK